MDISHEDFQRARRISRAIQGYLDTINQDGLRSTDVYPYLARQGLVEKDRHQGLHFRKFLRKLKDCNALQLIPQCSYQPTSHHAVEWYFRRVPADKQQLRQSDPEEAPAVRVSNISEEEADRLIKLARPHVEALPQRTDINSYTPQQIATRKNYPRAYELWTPREVEIMVRAFRKFGRVDKVATLLNRQPSVVKQKLRESGL